jgi:mRNA-degrading endonuclease RelE of RelBE toxin-antitoxin system
LETALLSLDENLARGAVTQENASLRHLLYRSKSYTSRIIYKIDEARKIVHILHIRHGSRKPM